MRCPEELGFFDNKTESVRMGYSLFSNELDKLGFHIKSRIFFPSGDAKPAPYRVEYYREAFHSEIESIPVINGSLDIKYVADWIKNQTHTALTEIYRPQSTGPKPLMLLVNTIHFKGFWKTLFNEDSRARMFFHPLGGAGTDVAAVKKLANFRVGQLGDCNARFIELPFENDPLFIGDSSLSMFIILPNEYENSKWKEFLSNLKRVNLTQRLSNSTEKMVDFSIPLFNVSSELSTNSAKSNQQSFYIELPLDSVLTFPMLTPRYETLDMGEAASKIAMRFTQHGIDFAASSGALYNKMDEETNRMTRSLGPSENEMKAESNPTRELAEPGTEGFKVDRPFVAVVTIHGEINSTLFAAHITGIGDNLLRVNQPNAE
ncbi:antichymotrypsin-2-like [Venturia canescens]|uniref:antichymotrypsin-2-like n=1 Tax=Venturia canescens TaxID=32260 RepID=UPI001C9C4ECC|nr:antichymotrypsin-2-like [Venturia canescens]